MKTIRFEFSHGGFAEKEKVARELQATVADASREMTDFGYLFPALQQKQFLLPDDKPELVISHLKRLGEAMIDNLDLSPEPEKTNSKIPPIYTYWGQFIDHDLTANTDRDARQALKMDITDDEFKPLLPELIIKNLKNLRHPTLDLDNIYGDGPVLDGGIPTTAADLYQKDDPVKLKVGHNADRDINGNSVLGDRIPPDNDLNRDLPRKSDQKAIIGDSRNDENLIVAQLHTAFLRFHNAVVDWIRGNEPENAKTQKQLFDRARNLVCWHYQWLVVHDFLKTLTLEGIVEDIIKNGLKFYKLKEGQTLFMPLEFSVAAYRFGHSMVRGVYDFNRNFQSASFNQLFAFTGNASGGIGNPDNRGPFKTLPFIWIIEWERFIDKETASQRQIRSARKIDTHLAFPLSQMLNEGNSETNGSIKELLKHLAKRNLLRGYLLSIPTGQGLATAMGVDKLTPEELKQDNSQKMNEALAPFVERTPAWYYLLKEAEVRAKGDSLGELGSRIVAETILGLILNDPNSYIKQQNGWEPSKGVKLPNDKPILTIGDLLKFAGVLP